MNTLLAREPVDFVVTLIDIGTCMIEPISPAAKEWVADAMGCQYLIGSFGAVDKAIDQAQEAGLNFANSPFGVH